MVPPLAEPSQEPLASPLHKTSVADALALSALGSFTVALALAVQPLASVTVKVYMPAATPLISSVVSPFDQL